MTAFEARGFEVRVGQDAPHNHAGWRHLRHRLHLWSRRAPAYNDQRPGRSLFGDHLARPKHNSPRRLRPRLLLSTWPAAGSRRGQHTSRCLRRSRRSFCSSKRERTGTLAALLIAHPIARAPGVLLSGVLSRDALAPVRAAVRPEEPVLLLPVTGAAASASSFA